MQSKPHLLKPGYAIYHDWERPLLDRHVVQLLGVRSGQTTHYHIRFMTGIATGREIECKPEQLEFNNTTQAGE